MAKKVQRFNLQFNLNKEEEAEAAALLDTMGRKKAALVARALNYLLANAPGEIEDVKVFDFSKTSDLMMRASLRAQDNFVEPTTQEEAYKPKPPVKKPKPVQLQEKPVEVKEEIVEKPQQIQAENDDKTKKPISPDIDSEENGELLEDMLESLDAFLS